jgi:hypothetical protein
MFYRRNSILVVCLVSLIATSFLNADEPGKDIPVFREGVFKGQSVDTEKWSHAKEADAKQVEALKRHIPSAQVGEYYFFQNVKHNNVYHIAAVPKKVKAVTAYLEELMLNGKVAHGFFGMELEKSAILLRKDGTGTPKHVSDLVVSTDAARPIGVPFSPTKGFGPNLILHTNFQTIEQVYLDYNLKSQERADKVAEFPLEIAAERRGKLLENSIEMSKTTGYSRIYNTISVNNCCGQVFALLDSILPKPGFIGSCRRNLNHVAEFLPGLYRDGLRVRNLYNKAREGKLSTNSRFRKLIDRALKNDPDFRKAVEALE